MPAPAAAAPNPLAIRWKDGFRAMKALLRDKEDTTAVFRIIDAFAGRTRYWTSNRFRKLNEGRALLAERPNLLHTLMQRDKLASLPQDTLGYAYYQFTYGENLSADGLVEASEKAGTTRAGWDEETAWIGMRNRDSHDLWHVVTGYGREGYGELNLLAFTYAQTRNRGIFAILPLGFVKVNGRKSGLPTLRALFEAYNRGRKAAWLPVARWEELLERPLDEVRTRLKIKPAPLYQATRERAVALEKQAGVYPPVPAQA